MRAIFLVVVLLSSAPAAFAAGWSGTGAELETLCTGQESSFDAGACAGYVLSIADIMRDTAKGGALVGNEACFPTDVRVGQMVDALLKFLKQHSESRRYSAWSLTARAFAEAFPCGRK
ncbi:MAG: Rap1a/Tai family immunity protein [Betaproteobacteria bacterium]